MNILINVRDSKLVNITQGLTEFGKSQQQVTMSEYIHLRIIYFQQYFHSGMLTEEYTY